MKATALFTILALIVVVAESSTIPPSGCMHEGKWYSEGHHRVNPCQPCSCHAGRMVCTIVDCFFGACVDAVHKPDQCCPVCPNGPNCRAPDGQIIQAGQQVQINDHTICSCAHGHGGMFGNDALCAVKAPEPVTQILVS